MIRHIFNFITNNVLYVLVGLILGASACQTYWHSNPIVPSVSKDSSAIKVCLPTPFEQNIVGAWHFKMNTKTGTVIFNSDKTVVDSDSLFKFGRKSGETLTIKTEIYSLETLTIAPLISEGELFVVRGYAVDRLGNNIDLGGFLFRKVTVNECKHILLAAVGNDLLGPANKELDIDLTR